MMNIANMLEHCGDCRTVMIVRTASDQHDELIGTLSDAGLNVLGPVDRASFALAIAAQTPTDIAFVDPELAGVRDGFELARCLQETWGVRTVMLEQA